MFTQAAERFADVVEGLKRMAADMQHELETTRAELRRGILELPQETADSAAQMRRVIVDQIEALAELNRIVARHGRGIDAVEPTDVAALEAVRSRAAAAGCARSRLLTNGGPAARAGSRGRAPIITGMSPRRPCRRAGRSRPRSVPRAGAGDAPAGCPSCSRAHRRSRARRHRASRRRAKPRRAKRRRSDDRATRRSIDSLDSLAVDIARMIDHDAAAELWDRYNRGERNVFTRKLYTMQGQRAFEEIRRKYRSDREFMRTVDRYIGEFERLLEEVSRDDRGQVVARTYLTSETGKVYTMLAHAAGRFE